MQIQRLENGFEIEKLVYYKRFGTLGSGMFLWAAAFVMLGFQSSFAAASILFGIIFGWHLLHWWGFYRFHLKLILFLDDCVKIEYYDYNKLHHCTCSYRDLRISLDQIWYKTRDRADHLKFILKGELVFRQFCYSSINKAFLQDVINKFHAARYDK